VIINEKGPLTGKGGLYIYNLNGVLVQKVPVHQPQNPDLRYNVVFGRDTLDVLVCIDREAGNTIYNKVRVYKIDPLKAQATSGFLTEITTSAGIPTGQSEPYGHSLYLRPSDGALFSIVSPYGKTDFTQIKLESDGAGKVKGAIVRKWGGKDISGDLCEGICCDDEPGFIYICDENACVLKYAADPDMNDNALIGSFAKMDGIVSDREGIDIYRCAGSAGYILVSSQGNDQIKVYDRITNAFMGTVIPAGMKDCDGLDVTAMPMGAQFPHGMAAFHLGSTAGSQFGFYDWSEIANGLNLAKPCDAKRPQGPLPLASRAPNIPSSAYNRKPLKVTCLHDKTILRIAPSIKGIVYISLFGLNGQSIGTTHGGFAGANGINIPLNARAVKPGAYLIRISAKNSVQSEELFMVR
jgi:3-phytase